MCRVVTRFGERWSAVTGTEHRDRGEFGPISYALMIAAVVLLAGVIVAWGNDLAHLFMDRLDGFEFDDPER